MMKFNGERWELFGPILEDAGPAGWSDCLNESSAAAARQVGREAGIHVSERRQGVMPGQARP